MLRVIDVDAYCENRCMCNRAFCDKEKCSIYLAPTIDAVPVVRCRDCKHAFIHPLGYVYCHRDGRNSYEMTFELDSFCSYGERKEGADNV